MGARLFSDCTTCEGGRRETGAGTGGTASESKGVGSSGGLPAIAG